MRRFARSAILISDALFCKIYNQNQDVSATHGKSFNFLKQHFLSHAIACFKDKGTSRNQNTRVGEGFQQEIAAQYKKTNGKDAEHQVRYNHCCL
jgi:hypothetical protein